VSFSAQAEENKAIYDEGRPGGALRVNIKLKMSVCLKIILAKPQSHTANTGGRPVTDLFALITPPIFMGEQK